MKQSIVGLLALSLGLAGCDTLESKPSESKLEITAEESLYDENPLLKGLREVVQENQTDAYLEVGETYIESEVEKVYNAMNQALAKKDMPSFIQAYQDAVVFSDQLQFVPHCYGGPFQWVALFNDLNRGFFGSSYISALADSSILENWPTVCPIVNPEAAALAKGLYNFDRTERLATNSTPDGRNGTGRFIVHDDEILTRMRAANIHSSAFRDQEVRYFIDGTYTDMWFSKETNIMLYTLFTSTHSSQLLGSTVVRQCSFIDLGMDGIDACDARLNRIAQEDISLANQRIIACMTQTTEVLKERYAGKGYMN